ncbi:hypothetical protein [Kytococcus sedentarius]|uniref:hypothetical protein n=1 Tax=Kytococcus sedentarius TaxID=1276 RepID=UPI0035BBBF7E
MSELVRLPHSLRPVLRHDGVVQLGSPPGRCVEVPDLTPGEYTYLCALAAPQSQRSHRVALERSGLDAAARDRLVARLRELDAVVDVSDPAHVREMCGARRDRLRGALHQLLASGATGGWETIEARDRATVVVDHGPPWAGSEAVGTVAHGLLERLDREGVGTLVGPAQAPRWWHDLGDVGSPSLADLVLPVFSARTDAVMLRQLVEVEIPHLPVVVTAGWVSIGPLVLPGQACTECVVRHEVPVEQVVTEWLGNPHESPQHLPGPAEGHTPADLLDWAVRWGGRTALWALDGAAGTGGTAGTGEQVATRVSVIAHSPMPRVEQFAVHPDCWCARRT